MNVAVTGMMVAVTEPITEAPAVRRRRPSRDLVIASIVIAGGLFLVVRGIAVGVSGDERNDYPDAVERVDPVPEAVQVPNQTELMIDLAPGYVGVLTIDDIEIETLDIGCMLPPPCPSGRTGTGLGAPGQQVQIPPATIYEPGNATLTFVPQEGAPVTGLDSGQHRAMVTYWPLDEGRQAARNYVWTFTVV